MKSNFFLGITGQQRTGKDTFADIITTLWGPIIHREMMAQPIKKIAKDIFGVSDEDLLNNKNTGLVKLTSCGNLYIRKLLQDIGTGFRRIYENIFIDLLIKRLEEQNIQNKIVLITDIRHTNEAFFIKGLQGKLLRLNRKDPEAQVGMEHESETSVGKLPASKDIHNNGTIDVLFSAALDLFKDIPQRLFVEMPGYSLVTYSDLVTLHNLDVPESYKNVNIYVKTM